MDNAGPPPEASVAHVGASRNSSSLLFGLSPAAASAAAASLVVLLVLAAAAAAAFFARRRSARPPSLSRVEHAPSSGSSHPASSSARKEKVADAEVREANASSSDAAGSSAAASSLESPARRKVESIRVCGAAGVAIGWGRWYDLPELEAATGGFLQENVVGEGGYGTVYRGVLSAGEVVAVKDLFDHK
jgi:hypothetical protein